MVNRSRLMNRFRLINRSRLLVTNSDRTGSRPSVRSGPGLDCGLSRLLPLVHIDDTLNVKLSYEGCPIPLPSYIDRAEGSRFTICLQIYPCTVGMLRGLVKQIFKILKYCNPKGRPSYSTSVLRFALIMRYASYSARQYLKHFLRLPSNSLCAS